MGRLVFGLAALCMGVASLSLQQQLISEWQLPGAAIFNDVTAVAQMAGGVAILLRRWAPLGATILAAVYAVFAMTFVPDIFGQPLQYYTWGDVCYALAPIIGAVLVAGLVARPSSTKLYRAAIIVFGVCNISYAIEQYEFMARTVSLVPKWVPPNGLFWAWLTAFAFALAGISLIAGYRAVLASRLLASMLWFCGVAIWIPALVVDRKTLSNWSEGIETFMIGAVAWIVADYLAKRKAAARR